MNAQHNKSHGMFKVQRLVTTPLPVVVDQPAAWKRRVLACLLALGLTSTCVAGYSLGGRVSTPSGTNVWRARLELSAGTRVLGTAETDETGRFCFYDLAPGSYTITPSRSGLFPSCLGFEPALRTAVVLDRDQTNLDFLLPAVTCTPGSNSQTGDGVELCMDENEYTFYCSAATNPAFVQIEFPGPHTFFSVAILPGAHGEDWFHDWYLEAADSQADLDSQSGTYQLVVQTNYHLSFFQWGRVTFAAPVTHRFWRVWVQTRVGPDCVFLTEFRLEDTPPIRVSLQGTVRDVLGQPLAGALVSAVKKADHSVAFHASTESNGSYLLPIEPAEYVVSASQPGYQPQTLPPGVFPTNQDHVDFALAPLPVLTDAFYVLVNATLYESLAEDLSTYTNDVAQQGYIPIVLSTLADTPLRLRTLLQAAFARGMVGCLLVGDFPVPWYKEPYPGTQYCASDLFYSDLDGTWEDPGQDDSYDLHTGHRGADIILGRLTASNLHFAPQDNEVGLLENYFRKAHCYRTGQLRRSRSACLFVTDDWDHSTPEYRTWLGYAFSNLTVVLPPDTTGETYRRCLTNDFETIQAHTHASPDGHGLWPSVSSADVRNLDPRALFYVLWGCSAADYRSENYLAGWYIFSASSALIAIGETFSSGIAGLEYLYQPLADGLTWGETCRLRSSLDGYQILASATYAETLLGDPTLRIQSERPPQIVSAQASLDDPELMRVAWKAITRSHANLKYYDVQYRSEASATGNSAAEPWTDLLTNTPNSTLVFAGRPQRTYTFRCRAVDYAGNVGPYAESNPIQIPASDSDGNALPDWWETRYFGQLGVDPAADPDHDGATNLAEYEADTNPRDPADVLRVLSCRVGDDGTNRVATISWTSKAGRFYRLLQSEGLAPANWQQSSLGPIQPDGPVTTRQFPASHAAGQFFCVAVVRPSAGL